MEGKARPRTFVDKWSPYVFYTAGTLYVLFLASAVPATLQGPDGIVLLLAGTVGLGLATIIALVMLVKGGAVHERRATRLARASVSRSGEYQRVVRQWVALALGAAASAGVVAAVMMFLGETSTPGWAPISAFFALFIVAGFGGVVAWAGAMLIGRAYAAAAKGHDGTAAVTYSA